LGIAYNDPFLYGLDIANDMIYRFNTEILTEVDSYSWGVGYPLGLHFDANTGNFVNVSSKAEYGGDESVYMVGITTGIDEPYTNTPDDVRLSHAYPNPFNASTTISFTLEKPAAVTLYIYDILGRKTASLVDEYLPAGDHSVLWDANELPSGVYFYRITADDWVDSRKVTLIK
jgi:hypothetical protein